MGQFVCKNCGFTLEPGMGSCPICGETVQGGGGQQRTYSAAAAEPAGSKASKTAPFNGNPEPAVHYGAQFLEFPKVREERMNRELEAKTEETKEELRRSEGEVEAKAEEKNKKLLENGSLTIFVLTETVALIASFGVSCYSCVEKNKVMGAIGDFIVTFIVVMIIGIVLDFVVMLVGAAFADASRKKQERNMENQKEAAQKGIKQRQTQTEASIQEYALAFDKAVKSAVPKFVSNKTTEAIGNCILGNFMDRIAAAPRDQKNSDIIVSCSYEVYADQVQHQSGVFSFSQNHCSHLSGPVEQAALAQAIASYLEFRVLEWYKKDPSGSIPWMETDAEDSALARKMTVYYKAVNANYRGI